MIRTEHFHEHLDKCQQCRDRPFDLCPAGALLLMLAAQDALGEIMAPMKMHAMASPKALDRLFERKD